MSGADDQPESPTSGGAPERRGRVDWRFVGRRVLVWFVLAVLAYVVVLLLARTIPSWWAQVVADLVNGEPALGVWWGLFFGAVCTGVPLAVAWQAARPGRTVPLRITFIVVALLLTAPNLFTLSVVLGTNEAALAGERLLDADAPAFRAATAWGAAIGAAVATAILVLWAAFRRRGHKIRDLEGPEK